MDNQLVKNIVLATVPTVAAATLGSVATDTDTRWYRRLKKPSWQPPAAVFPIAWTALYGTIAGASSAALNKFESEDDSEQSNRFKLLLYSNLALNTAWSVVFFKGKALPAATVTAGALAVSSTALARQAGKASPGLGWLLAPYAAWTTFATALTAAIWKKNAN